MTFRISVEFDDGISVYVVPELIGMTEDEARRHMCSPLPIDFVTLNQSIRSAVQRLRLQKPAGRC